MSDNNLNKKAQDLLKLGYKEFINKKYESAEKLFKEAINLQPDSAEAHAWIAAVYGRKIDAVWSLTEKIELFPLLEKEINMALELDHTLPMARRMNGSKLLNTPDMLGGDPAAAIKEFQYCIDQGMNDIELWISIARSYIKIAAPVKAKEALKEAAKLEPKSKQIAELMQQVEG
ncbi:hypothetical protein JCM21714_3038 [Gracilibacillus boraciitolerans JCM 21714]|uniref:Tetratricopeptide repeat protein n=1 Tax=Gracilibacillus boraciitolerans JCM 21714 TaxID=1298598 RepID=W4VMH7_9BACI|nr:tetratricopeptide repeat protein [Gracilibacillus boraciitolerans]GAE93919.1 hypothetical protein JCM21714_3038 [Gracilibacillus boraciitolerans JCM 21714]